MSTVTHKKQPGVRKTAVPLEGTSHLYRVNKLLWPESVSDVLSGLLIGRSVHVCCGKSLLGDVRVDIDKENSPDIICDAADMSEFISDGEFDTVLCDPPYSGKFQWNHDVLSELSRIASKRIIFQHWFIPATKAGMYKKAQDRFALSDVFIWQPQTYFGRVNVISVFDCKE